MQDVIGWIIMYAFAGAAILFPLFVIIQSIMNFVRATDGRGAIIIKALTVLGVWAFLTFTFVLITFMYVFEVGEMRDRAAADRRVTMLAVVLTLIYLAVGALMAYWVRLQPGWKTLREAGQEGPGQNPQGQGV